MATWAGDEAGQPARLTADAQPRPPLFADGRRPRGGRAWWVTPPTGSAARRGCGTQKSGGHGAAVSRPNGIYREIRPRRARSGPARAGDTGLDWRGQGLGRPADRRPDGGARALHFTDYQQDVAAMLAAAREAGPARPWHLLAHSMGGCIGLRAAMEGLPVTACAFTGPMWGIRMADALRPVAWSLSWGSKRLGSAIATHPARRATLRADGTVRDQQADPRPRHVRLHDQPSDAPIPSWASAGPACAGCTRRCAKRARWPAAPRPTCPA